MKTRMLILTVLFVLTSQALTGCRSLGFGAEPTAAPTVTPHPTYTPYPTLTPPATYTPWPTLTPYPTRTPPPTATRATPHIGEMGEPVIGARWAVTVTGVTASREFGDWSINKDSDYRFVIVTVDFKNLAPDESVFYPGSIVLVHTGAEGKGWARTPSLYRGGSIADRVTDLSSALVVSYFRSGSTAKETYVFEYAPDFTEFLLLFPETPAIRVTVK